MNIELGRKGVRGGRQEKFPKNEALGPQVK